MRNSSSGIHRIEKKRRGVYPRTYLPTHNVYTIHVNGRWRHTHSHHPTCAARYDCAHARARRLEAAAAAAYIRRSWDHRFRRAGGSSRLPASQPAIQPAASAQQPRGRDTARHPSLSRRPYVSLSLSLSVRFALFLFQLPPRPSRHPVVESIAAAA